MLIGLRPDDTLFVVLGNPSLMTSVAEQAEARKYTQKQGTHVSLSFAIQVNSSFEI